MTRLVLLALLAGLAGCSAPAPDAKPPEPSALVTVDTATGGSLATRLTVYGAADGGSGGERTLTAPVESTVTEIVARPGARVAVGAVVARLRPTPAAALERSRAAADVGTTAAALARARRLRADGLVSDAEVETARAAAKTASSTDASLRARDVALVLRAPVAATVTAVAANPGEQLAAGAVVAKLAVPGGVRARFGIEPELARHIARGTPVTIRPGGSSPEFTVRITDVDPTADPVTRLATLFADLPPAAHIASGETLSGTLVTGRSIGVGVADAALLDDGGQPFVFVVRDGVARRRDVTTGSSYGGQTAIVRGVAAGDMVVTSGGTALEDGMAVRLARAPAAPARR